MFIYNAELLTQTRRYLIAVLQAETGELERNLAQPRNADLDYGADKRRERIAAYRAALRALPRMRGDKGD